MYCDVCGARPGEPCDLDVQHYDNEDREDIASQMDREVEEYYIENPTLDPPPPPPSPPPPFHVGR